MKGSYSMHVHSFRELEFFNPLWNLCIPSSAEVFKKDVKVLLSLGMQAAVEHEAILSLNCGNAVLHLLFLTG